MVCPEDPAGAAPPDAAVCDVATCWVRVAHEAVRGSVGATYSYNKYCRSKELAIRSPSSDLRTMVALVVVRFSVSLLRCFLDEGYEWWSKRCKS